MKTSGPANVRLPDDLKARVVAVACRNTVSVSDVVRMALLATIGEMEAGGFRLRPPRIDEGEPV